MELTDIEKFNPWWKTGKVSKALLKDYKRKPYAKIKKYFDRRQIILIQGLRRVGKTVLMMQLIKETLRDNPPENIIYFSFDEIAYDLKDVLKTYQELVLQKPFEKTNEKIFLFLDEIQKVEDWENKIKVFYDLCPNLKIILSGSSSIGLRKKSKESLAGRIITFEIPPLDFEEFLELNSIDVRKIKKSPELWKAEIMPLFYRYIKYGSFPELATETDENFAREYLLNSIVEKIIYKDIAEEFNIKEIDLLKRLLYLVGKNPGMIVNFSEIAKNLGRDERTISNYFEYMEYGLLINFVYNYRNSPLATMRKMKKVYLSTPNLIFALNPSFIEILPKILENVVAVKSEANYFYHNSYEVDFIKEVVGGLLAIEVKLDGKTTRQLKKLVEDRKFSKQLKEYYIVDLENERKIGEIKVVPAWKFLLGI